MVPVGGSEYRDQLTLVEAQFHVLVKHRQEPDNIREDQKQKT